MSTSAIVAEGAKSVEIFDREVIIVMQTGAVIRFDRLSNSRLAGATRKQLEKFELSPFGIHWPDLDEDLSFRGMLAGDFGK